MVHERSQVVEYRQQVSKILRLTEGRSGRDSKEDEKENKGNEIARFSGEDRAELRGWKVQLALKMAGKAKIYNTEQK